MKHTAHITPLEAIDRLRTALEKFDRPIGVHAMTPRLLQQWNYDEVLKLFRAPNGQVYRMAQLDGGIVYHGWDEMTFEQQEEAIPVEARRAWDTVTIGLKAYKTVFVQYHWRLDQRAAIEGRLRAELVVHHWTEVTDG